MTRARVRRDLARKRRGFKLRPYGTAPRANEWGRRDTVLLPVVNKGRARQAGKRLCDADFHDS